MMGNPVKQCGSHFLIPKDLYPFGEIEIGGDDQRGLLIQLANEVKQ